MHLKIGSDHDDGGSFKASFQVGNVLEPNKSCNTVIWSIFEAKAYRSNLLLCLERFKAHIAQLIKVSWHALFKYMIFDTLYTQIFILSD